jgi:hypothetical protein
MSSKSRLFVILIDLLDLERPGILPGFFYDAENAGNARTENTIESSDFF